MDFSEALNELKNGKKLYREKWNGKEMYVLFQCPTVDSKMSDPYLYMKTNDGELVPFVCSQTDILADDWQIYHEGKELMVLDYPLFKELITNNKGKLKLDTLRRCVGCLIEHDDFLLISEACKGYYNYYEYDSRDDSILFRGFPDDIHDLKKVLGTPFEEDYGIMGVISASWYLKHIPVFI